MSNSQLVNDLLLSVQMLRRNMMANEGRAYIANAFPNGATDEQIEQVLTDIYPWVWGPKSIMQALIKLGEREPSNQEIYNLLIIANRLDNTGAIKLAYEIYTHKKLPEASLSIIAEGA